MHCICATRDVLRDSCDIRNTCLKGHDLRKGPKINNSMVTPFCIYFCRKYAITRLIDMIESKDSVSVSEAFAMLSLAEYGFYMVAWQAKC